MKIKSLVTSTAAALLVLASAGNAMAAEWSYYASQPVGTKLKVDGTSTVHDWTIETSLVGGAMQLPPGFPLDKSIASIPEVKETPKVKVLIPVRRLASGKQAMDNVMQQAMKAEESPMIQFQLTEFKANNEGRKAGDPLTFDTKGKLTVSGKSKDVDLPVSFDPQADGKIKVTGSTKVKMSDFGIDPPAPKVALGLIKTGDEVTVSFEWLTAPK